MDYHTGRRVFMGILKIFLLIVLLYLLVTWGKKAYEFGYGVFAQEAVSLPPGREVAVTLAEGTSVTNLAKTLKNKGLIKDANVFYIQYLLSEQKGKLKAGSYLLSTAQTANEMLQIMAGETGEESAE